MKAAIWLLAAILFNATFFNWRQKTDGFVGHIVLSKILRFVDNGIEFSLYRCFHQGKDDWT
jgi:hypothetical protein